MPAFRPAPSQNTLAQVIVLHVSRQASNGSTISYHGTTYRLLNRDGHPLALKPKTRLSVLTSLDGTLSALYQGRLYRLEPVPQGRRIPSPTTDTANPSAPSKTPRKPKRPAADHPWRQSARKTIASGLGPIERYVDRLLGQDLDAQFWKEIYAQC